WSRTTRAPTTRANTDAEGDSEYKQWGRGHLGQGRTPHRRYDLCCMREPDRKTPQQDGERDGLGQLRDREGPDLLRRERGRARRPRQPGGKDRLHRDPSPPGTLGPGGERRTRGPQRGAVEPGTDLPVAVRTGHRDGDDPRAAVHPLAVGLL